MPAATGFDRGTVMSAHPPAAVGAVNGLDTSCRWLASAVEMAAMASGNWPLSADPNTAGWTCFPKIATRTVHAGSRSVRASRNFAVATLQRWGAAERRDDIAVVVSELLTNALRHTLPETGPAPPAFAVRFGLLQPGRCVICAVADPSPEVPLLKDPGIFDETGRGLHVIGALADIWGHTPPGNTGKVVWALFASCVPAVRQPRPVSGTYRPGLINQLARPSAVSGRYSRAITTYT
jgi:hypothetical protein